MKRSINCIRCVQLQLRIQKNETGITVTLNRTRLAQKISGTFYILVKYLSSHILQGNTSGLFYFGSSHNDRSCSILFLLIYYLMVHINNVFLKINIIPSHSDHFTYPASSSKHKSNHHIIF